jgi:hypothetical protein
MIPKEIMKRGGILSRLVQLKEESPYKPDFSFLTPKYQKAQVMTAAGITFQRSFELLEAALTKIPRNPTITKNLGSHFNLIGSVWKICLNIQT